jgi:hypothetical protein
VNLDIGTGNVVSNTGTPGSSATPNLADLSTTNNRTIPNIATLAVWAPNSVIMSPGANNTNGQQSVDTGGHIGFHGSSPTYSSGCGGSATVVGNDGVGYVETSSTSSTACVLTFSHSFATPVYAPQQISKAVTQLQASSASISFSYSSGASLFFGWICLSID